MVFGDRLPVKHKRWIREEDSMVARYPGAIWHPVGTDHGPNNGPVAASIHTAITTGNGLAIAGWVSSSDACHGFVEQRGGCYQYKDFDRAVYGTLDGNYRGVITWESWDGLPVATATYDDVNRGSWPAEMCERLADICAFQEVDLGIAAQRMHGTRDHGVGGHCTGISHRSSLVGLNLYEGPDKWSVDMNKPCPGDKRIAQLYGPNMDGGDGSILARAREIAAGVRAGKWGYLPQGDVDLGSALARQGAGGDWFNSMSAADFLMGIAEVIR